MTIEALSDGMLVRMPFSDWERTADDWPDLHHMLHRVEAAQAARCGERMLRLGKGSAEMRIAYALLEFCIRLGAAGENDTSAFHIPLTQQKLGDYVGLSSVHVCRTMRRLVRNSIVEQRDHMDIRVLDPHALATLAGIDRRDLARRIMPDIGQGHPGG